MDQIARDLSESWTLGLADKAIVAAKRRTSQLSFAVLLLFYRFHGRFPRRASEIEHETIVVVAGQIGAPVEAIDVVDLGDRTLKRHRAEIRTLLGFREAAKRLSEYREIVATYGKPLLCQYRKSFGGCAELSLLISCVDYAMLSCFCCSVFLIKYRIEYLFLVPIIICLFSVYLALAMRPGSTAQRPERLFRERELTMIKVILAAMFMLTTFVDYPMLDTLTAQRFIQVQ